MLGIMRFLSRNSRDSDLTFSEESLKQGCAGRPSALKTSDLDPNAFHSVHYRRDAALSLDGSSRNGIL